VIADVHGDLASLRSALAAIDCADADAIWCLGDVVGLGATDPAATVDLVRERCTLVLAGNHDRWVTGHLSLDMLPLPRQRAELRWQRDQLSTEQLDWLARLSPHRRHGEVSLWHGSATDALTGWISSAADAAEHLTRQRTHIGLVGHTHRPLIASLGEGAVHYDDSPSRVDLTGGDRAVLNPGSVTGARRWLEYDVDAQVATWHAA